MRTLVFVVIYTSLLISGNFGCNFSQFSPKPESRPIFIQKVGGQSLVLPVHGSELQIEESGSVQVFCPGGFRKEALRSDSKDHISESTTVELSCIGGRIVRLHDDRTYHFEYDESLNCTRPPFGVYENRQMHRFCEGTSYVVGMLYEREPITLAEICYDMNKMKVKYQNYKAIERSPVIARKHEYEPLIFYPFEEELVNAPSEQFYQHFLLTQNHTRRRFMHKSAEYIYEDLIPGDAFEPYYVNAINSAKALSKIFWWKGLKGGNWRLFEKILKRRSSHVSYDIVLGIMGTSPDCDIRQGPLSEISLACSVTPKLIWAFLSDEDYDEEFVVIGVNTPYFELLPTEDTIICEDICDSISWLEPLNKFRNISALGYIYCCKAEEVMHKMEGVSDLFFKKRYRYEQEYEKTSPVYPAEDTYGNGQNSQEKTWNEPIDPETSNNSDEWDNTVDTKFSGESSSKKKENSGFSFWGGK